MVRHSSRVLASILVACAGVVSACGGDSTGPSVASIRFVQTSYILAVGATSRVDLVAYDSRNNPVALTASVQWSSDDAARVSVDADGTVHGHALGGPVTITATAGGRVATVGVIVRPASVSISPRPDSVVVGQSVQLVAVAHATNGDAIQGSAPIWSVTPATVAAISSTGVLTTLAPGPFTVNVTIDGVSDQLLTGVSSIYDGGWIAHTLNSLNKPQDILFEVRYGTVLRFILADIPTNCGPSPTGQFNTVLGVPIVGGHFSYQMSLAGLLTGTFDSASSFTGVFSSSAGPVSSFSIGTLACGNGTLSSVNIPTGTFTATRP